MEDERKCFICLKKMSSGFVIESGLKYYCSDDCLHFDYTDEEWKTIYDEGNSDSYWTEFQ